MKKILMMIMVVGITLTGCGELTAEDIAMQSKFDVSFTELNNDKLTATFDVAGLPNEDEFNQISTIITDSLESQKLESNQLYTVNVYSDGQDMTAAPDFGIVTFKDGGIVDNNLKNITVDQYLSLSEKETK